MDWTAIAIAGVGVLAFACPLILHHLTKRAHDVERTEDCARQDRVAAEARQVAKQAREAAALLSDAQQVTITKTDEVAATAKKTTAETHSQLRQIRALANGNLSTALKGELGQAKISLLLLKQLGTLVRRKATADELAKIETTQARITELEAELAERAEAERSIVETGTGN